MIRTSSGSHKKQGFTIVEALISMSIVLLIMAGVLPMYLQSSKRIMESDSKYEVNEDVRKFTNEIISQAREADSFVLYDNYSGTWIDGDFVNFRSDTYAGMGRKRDGEAGRFLLLLYYGEDPYPNDSEPAPLDHMIGIYLDAEEDESEGPLRFFFKDTIDDSKCLEENIPGISSSKDHEMIVESIEGLMDGDIFYNFSSRSIMVNGKISHRTGAISKSNTYNFTITPR